MDLALHAGTRPSGAVDRRPAAWPERSGMVDIALSMVFAAFMKPGFFPTCAGASRHGFRGSDEHAAKHARPKAFEFRHAARPSL